MDRTPTPSETSSIPPWWRGVVLRPKPVETPYGVVEDGALVGCSREELLKRCSGPNSQIVQVWTPEHPHISTVFEVRDLFEIIRKRTRDGVLGGLRNALLFTAALGFFWWNDGFSFYSMMFLLMVILGVLPAVQSVWRLIELQRLTPTEMAGWVDSSRYESWLAKQRAPVTVALILVLVGIFLLQLMVGEPLWLLLTALDKEAVRDGKLVSLFTSTWVHGNVPHILFNGYALYFLGRPTEVLAGRWALLQVLVVSMLTGGLFSVFLVPQGMSVGASGGILGLLGFLVVLGFRYRSRLPRHFARTMVANVVLVACLGLAGWKLIDNAGHLGGLAGGALMGSLLIPRVPAGPPLPVPPASRVTGWLALAVAVLGVGLTLSKLLLKW